MLFLALCFYETYHVRVLVLLSLFWLKLTTRNLACSLGEFNKNLKTNCILATIREGE